MYQKQCRLTIADKYYGGGGPTGDQFYLRNLSKEWPQIKKGYGFQQAQYRQYRGDEPILKELYPGAIDYFKGGPSPLLKELQGQALEDVRNRGALTAGQEGDVRTSTLATAGAMGLGNTPGTLGTELLNREKYREQREQTARGFATGVEGMSMADIAQRFQIPQNVLQGGVSTFGQLTNPILDYLSKAFTPTTLSQQPGSNKGSSAISAGGSIIGAAIPVIAGAV